MFSFHKIFSFSLPENYRNKFIAFATTRIFIFIYLGSKVHASYARTTLKDPTPRECLIIVESNRSQILFRVHALVRDSADSAH